MKAAIVAPVSRRIGVADLERTTAFYRDVLGFEVQGTEAASGPALLHFDVGVEGPSMVFLETDDVAAMQLSIRNRGGAPSEIAKVNWVKMQVFETRDPDGNTVWFGQSYDKPHREVADSMFQKALPRLPLTDLAAGIAHYREVLGFQVNYEDSKIGVMFRDRVTVLLFSRRERNAGAGEAYFYIADADRLCAEMRARGADVRGDPVSFPWGLREFSVRDLEGNELYFGQTFE